jgi:hypothetical protein
MTRDADDWDNWMLQYSLRRKATVNAEDAIREHHGRILRGEQTEYASAWDAAKAEIVKQIAD